MADDSAAIQTSLFVIPGGKQNGTIDVPDRPISLIFGGKDGKTLFILTHSTLYSIQNSF